MRTAVLMRLLRSKSELTPLVRIEIAKRLDQQAHEATVLKEKVTLLKSNIESKKKVAA